MVMNELKGLNEKILDFTNSSKRIYEEMESMVKKEVSWIHGSKHKQYGLIEGVCGLKGSASMPSFLIFNYGTGNKVKVDPRSLIEWNEEVKNNG